MPNNAIFSKEIATTVVDHTFSKSYGNGRTEKALSEFGVASFFRAVRNGTLN
jgi:hypothetical protein